MSPEYFNQRFLTFLSNEFPHLEKKVAALEAKMHLVIGMLSVLVGLMVYAVIK